MLIIILLLIKNIYIYINHKSKKLEKKMNSDLLKLYESNLHKNYDLLDTQIAKSYIYEKENLTPIIESIDNLFSITTKSTRDYIIGLTLNVKTNLNSSKIKKAENKLKDYRKKIKDIKEKHNNNKSIKKEIILNHNEIKMNEKTEYDSYIGLNQAIRVSTEIENISGNILTDLNSQSNIMKNNVKKVGELNNDIDTSKRYLNKMINKENFDKKIIISVGFCLFMILLCTLLYKIYRKFNFQK